MAMKKDELTQNAYPVMVLQALEAGHIKYDDIQSYIQNRHGKNVSTKTIYRHIKLIKSLGFKITDTPPYVIWPSDQKSLIIDESEGSKFGHAAYPLMMLVALQSECNFYDGIIERIDKIYNTRIERKAIGRNLKLLGIVGYPVFDPYFYFNYQLDKRE